MIQRKAVILPILVILSVQAVIGSFLYFQYKSDKTDSYLTSELGRVAGISDSKVVDLTKEIPIIPEAEIISVDTSHNEGSGVERRVTSQNEGSGVKRRVTSQNSAAITVQSTLPQEEIETYYDDHMLLNGWNQTDENTYKKEDRELKIEITEDIIKLTLYLR